MDVSKPEHIPKESSPMMEIKDITPPPHENPILKLPQEELLISLHSLSILSYPYNLKLIS